MEMNAQAMKIAALAVCGLILIAPLAQTAVAQERQRPQYLDNDCVDATHVIAHIEAQYDPFEESAGYYEWYEEASCDCTDLRSSIAYVEDIYERRDYKSDEVLDAEKYFRRAISLLQRKFDQLCEGRQAAQAQEQRCIIAGEHGGKTMGLGARTLEEDADSRVFVFVDQAAVEAAESFVKELNNLDHEGDLPSKWELRCEQ